MQYSTNTPDQPQSTRALGFTMIQDATLDAIVDHRLSGVEVRIWARLVRIRQYTTDKVRVTRARLAEAVGCTVKAVGRALHRLREVGLLDWEGHHRRASTYSVRGLRRRGDRAGDESSSESLEGHRSPSVEGHRGPSISPDVYSPPIREVGSTGSNPPPVREINEPEKNTHADDLIEDPRREVRRRTVVNDRRLVEEGAEEIAGRADPVAALGLVRADVRLRRLARDSVADVIDEYLAPAEGLDVIYSAERAVPYLGDRGRPFDGESAVSARFRAMLGATDDADSDTYARSVWQRVRRAAVWEELTPRVVEAAVRELGAAPVLIAESAALGVSGPSSAADAMVLEIWTQVKAQRMSIRSVCDATDRVIA